MKIITDVEMPEPSGYLAVSYTQDDSETGDSAILEVSEGGECVARSFTYYARNNPHIVAAMKALQEALQTEADCEVNVTRIGDGGGSKEMP